MSANDGLARGMNDALASLLSQPLLHALPETILSQLVLLPIAELPAGVQVFDRHVRCGGFPVILSGEVRVFRNLANGRRIELYRVAPDEPCILSLGCLLGGDEYPASGITTRPTRMIVMPPVLFNQCLDIVPAFRSAIFHALGERLVNVMSLVEEITTLKLDVRLASALLQHAGLGRDAATASQNNPIAITHQQLADELGTVREMISRLLDEFARNRLVKLARGRIEIADPKGMRALAHDAR